MAVDGDERSDRAWERVEAKLDALSERLRRSEEGFRILGRKVDLTRAELRVRIDALRVEPLDDLQAALKVGLGRRRIEAVEAR